MTCRAVLKAVEDLRESSRRLQKLALVANFRTESLGMAEVDGKSRVETLE